MLISAITTAEELFLNDISAEDYQAVVSDHSEDCSCHHCQIFSSLLKLDQIYASFLQGQVVEKSYLKLCQRKQRKFES